MQFSHSRRFLWALFDLIEQTKMAPVRWCLECIFEYSVYRSLGAGRHVRFQIQQVGNSQILAVCYRNLQKISLCNLKVTQRSFLGISNNNDNNKQQRLPAANFKKSNVLPHRGFCSQSNGNSLSTNNERGPSLLVRTGQTTLVRFVCLCQKWVKIVTKLKLCPL